MPSASLLLPWIAMPPVRIDSIEDPRLEPYRHLKDTNQSRWAGRFICEGEKLVRRLLDSRYRTLSVLLDDPHAERLLPLVPPEADAFIVPAGLVSELVGFNFHRGVLACGQRQEPPLLESIVTPLDRPLTLAVCPDVVDPVNLGSIARIAWALGIDALVLGPRCGDPFSRRVLRVSMGAVLRLPILPLPNLAMSLVELRDRYGIELAATVLSPAAEPLDQARRSRRFALLLGNEGEGLAEELVAICQRRLTIPMHPGADSLNVSVAAGLFFYHFTRPASWPADRGS
jgi:tRNA G18 (ribose-2'-O)-methylase SpoU